MKQTEQKLSISVHHFSSQVAGPVWRSLRDLFSSATLDRSALLDLSGPGDVVAPIMIDQ